MYKDLQNNYISNVDSFMKFIFCLLWLTIQTIKQKINFKKESTPAILFLWAKLKHYLFIHLKYNYFAGYA